MKRIFFLLLLGLLSFCSHLALAQTYYEFAYKNQAGKQCYGFMIYEDDDNCTMRVVEVSKDQEVTASKDIKYTGQQGVEDGQKYTALVPEKQEANAPNIMFFWDKIKGSKTLEPVPVFCFDLEKLDVQEPESFGEVGLADMDAEYLQQFYEESEPTYKSLMKAKKRVVRQRSAVAKKLGDGTDIYRTVMTLLAENGVNVDISNLPTATTQTNPPTDEKIDNDGRNGNMSSQDSDELDDEDDESDDWNDGDESETSNQGGNSSGNANQGSNAPIPDGSGVTLHFVSVINSNVQDIGASCERDYENLKSELKGVAQALGLQFKDYNVMGDAYSRDAVSETIDGFRPGSNDVVFFYYSGHGFRFDDQQSRYPAIALTTSAYEDITENYLLMSDIYKEICSKNARLNIVLSDCCNTPIGVEQPPAYETAEELASSSNHRVEKPIN